MHFRLVQYSGRRCMYDIPFPKTGQYHFNCNSSNAPLNATRQITNTSVCGENTYVFYFLFFFLATFSELRMILLTSHLSGLSNVFYFCRVIFLRDLRINSGAWSLIHFKFWFRVGRGLFLYSQKTRESATVDVKYI